MLGGPESVRVVCFTAAAALKKARVVRHIAEGPRVSVPLDPNS